MNFVIFSYNFLPANDAEGFCGARFASALADAGHNVHVVTMAWPQAVDTGLCRKLLSSEVKVTSVPFAKNHNRLISNLRYLIKDRAAVNLPNCIREVKNVLSKYEQPILISRGLPILSSIVGWHCRKYAQLWVSHFSDPFPMMQKPKSLLARVAYELERMWGCRCINDADVVSLTCAEAECYFSEEYKNVWTHEKLCVLTHIGDPWIPADKQYVTDDCNRIVSHAGTLGRGRCLELLSDALDIVAAKHCDLTFVEAGLIKRKDIPLFKTVMQHQIYENATPDLTASIVESSSASIIIDLKTYLPYIPYLPSKFAYQIFTDVPIVVVSQPDSAMYRYCTGYPNAGLFFADNTSATSVACAIEKALYADRSAFDRTVLRELFSGKQVVSQLLSKI